MKSDSVSLAEDLFQQYYQRWLSGQQVDHDAFLQPVIHVLASPGKLLRPRIGISVALDVGMDPQALLPLLLALELVHVSSLIHDDLPGLDNDDYRRGKPTLHKAFNEYTAILTGDYLIGCAFELVGSAELSGESLQKVLKSFSAVFRQLCQGQQRDLNHAHFGDGDVIRIRQLKTGALFRLSFLLPILSQDFEDLELNYLITRLGDDVGELFQLLDDFDDTTRDSSLTQKRLEEEPLIKAVCDRVLSILTSMHERSGRPFVNTRYILSELSRGLLS